MMYDSTKLYECCPLLARHYHDRSQFDLQDQHAAYYLSIIKSCYKMLLKQLSHVKLTVTRGSTSSDDSSKTSRRKWFAFGKNKVANDKTPEFASLGGVFFTDEILSFENYDKQSSISIRTDLAGSSHNSSSCSESRWTSSGSPAHHKRAPLVVKRSKSLLGISHQQEDDLGKPEDEAAALGIVMARARKLPSSVACFSSNHIMINSERTKRLAQPLVRVPALDKLARSHAAGMAAAQQLYHSENVDLQDRIGKPSLRLGENVTRGATLKDMHIETMKTVADKNNIIDRRFTSMGIGTAKSSDGTLYLCQIFRA
jgi:hypothetical protein